MLEPLGVMSFANRDVDVTKGSLMIVHVNFVHPHPCTQSFAPKIATPYYIKHTFIHANASSIHGIFEYTWMVFYLNWPSIFEQFSDTSFWNFHFWKHSCTNAGTV